MKDFVNGPMPDGLSCKEYLIDAEEYFIKNWIPSRFSSGYIEIDEERNCDRPGDRFSLENPIELFACHTEKVTYQSYYEFDGKKLRVNKRIVPNRSSSLERQLKEEANFEKDQHLNQLLEEFNHTILDPAFEMYDLWKKSYIFSYNADNLLS